MDVSEICARLNDRAEALAPELLPNGRRAGNVWQFSGIEDHGRSWSAWLYLSGPQIGHWEDAGNAAPGEEKGDLLDLVQIKRCGGDKREAVQWAKAELGIADDFRPGKPPELSPEEKARKAEEARERAEAQQARLEKERRKKSKNAKRLYLTGGPIEGTGAEMYLLDRGVPPFPGGAAAGSDAVGKQKAKPWPGSLRFAEAIPYKPLGIHAPAMLAGVFTAEGQQIGTHRTFLAQDGGRWTKIQHAPAKMMLGCKQGGFIPISQGSTGKSMRDMPEGEPVYVTEGIEDALCVRGLKPNARIVAAIDLGNLRQLVLPPRVRELVIVADRDEGEKAQAALERAIAAHQARGLRVQLVLPPLGIKDINDWVRAAQPRKRRA